jgi:hypothetical protein
MTYKGMMFSDVPNLVSTFGYTNASWTLKADLTARFVCRPAASHGAPRPRRRDGAPRPDGRRATLHRFLVGLCSARGGDLAEAGRAKAVAALPELPARSADAALRPDRRRHPGFRACGGPFAPPSGAAQPLSVGVGRAG